MSAGTLPTRSARPDAERIAWPPTVSVVVPLFNERAHLDRLLADIESQNYPALREIFFVDGGSTDGTLEGLRMAWAADSRISLIHNPRRTQAAALNIGFALATSDVIIRLDAHARYAPNVIERSVAALTKTGAGGSGAIARLEPATTPMGKAIVLAHESRLGIGGSDFRQEGAEGWVATVWNGCYWREVIDQVGPFREDLDRVEDNDFHARVRALGYGIYLSPDIRASYVPRRTLGGLWRQYFSTGRGVARALPSTEGAVGLRHLAPAVFVSGMLCLATLAMLFSPFRWLFAAVVGVYSLAIFGAALSAWSRHRTITAVGLLVVLPALHAAYGFGSLGGLVSLLGDRTRRVAGPPEPQPAPETQPLVDHHRRDPRSALGIRRRTMLATRFADLLLSGMAVIALTPIFSMMCGAVAITSPGPALYRAVRIGRHGQPFEVLKYRTMRDGSAQSGPGVTKAKDPRITAFGAGIRKYKLDELPQLLNVLFGEMSLVGPRPEDARYVARYTIDERRLLTLRPGITSPASLAYRNEAELLAEATSDDVYVTHILPAKLAVDLAGFERFTFGTYVSVLVRTVGAIMSNPEAVPPSPPDPCNDLPRAYSTPSERSQLSGTSS